MNFKKTIAIDFDGVLNEYTGYDEKDLQNPKRGVKEFLEKLNKKYTVIIFTSRNKSDVEHWIKRYHFEKYIKKVTNTKPPAVAYIDDRAIQFKGDYNTILDELEGFEPYWKNERG